MARPSEYDPSYCDRVIELGNLGASVVEMAYEIGVSRNTLETNWPAMYPEFLEAFNASRLASQVWWERKGRENLESTGFQASMWSRSMAARFPHDWREVKGTELSAPGGGPVQTVTRIELVAVEPDDDSEA